MTIEELSQLSDDELRVKVAEKVGWTTWKNKGLLGGFCARNPRGESFYHSCSTESSAIADSCPEYSTSLDAIHEAEATLENERVTKFEKALEEINTMDARVCDFSLYPSDRIWHATARQRAIAFLLV